MPGAAGSRRNDRAGAVARRGSAGAQPLFTGAGMGSGAGAGIVRHDRTSVIREEAAVARRTSVARTGYPQDGFCVGSPPVSGWRIYASPQPITARAGLVGAEGVKESGGSPGQKQKPTRVRRGRCRGLTRLASIGASSAASETTASKLHKRAARPRAQVGKNKYRTDRRTAGRTSFVSIGETVNTGTDINDRPVIVITASYERRRRERKHRVSIAAAVSQPVK